MSRSMAKMKSNLHSNRIRFQSHIHRTCSMQSMWMSNLSCTDQGSALTWAKFQTKKTKTKKTRSASNHNVCKHLQTITVTLTTSALCCLEFNVAAVKHRSATSKKFFIFLCLHQQMLRKCTYTIACISDSCLHECTNRENAEQASKLAQQKNTAAMKKTRLNECLYLTVDRMLNSRAPVQSCCEFSCEARTVHFTHTAKNYGIKCLEETRCAWWKSLRWACS